MKPIGQPPRLDPFPFRLLQLLLIGEFFARISHGQVAPIQYSQVWGNNGSTWNRAVLKDWSKVGYRQGDAAIPSWPVGVNVTSYGAVGNGTTDCTAAFNSALAACPANAAVFVPNGTYLISGYVNVTKNNTVLRGESRDGAIIKINTNLTARYGGDYSFGGGFLRIHSGSEKGIENLTIKFPPTPYAGHFNEIGQNGDRFFRHDELLDPKHPADQRGLRGRWRRDLQLDPGRAVRRGGGAHRQREHGPSRGRSLR